MAIQLSDNIDRRTGKPLDSVYLNGVTPWTNLAQVDAGIPVSYRYRGLTVLVGATEYWFGGGASGVLLANLVVKGGSNCIQVTQAEYDAIPVKDPNIRYFVSEPGDGTNAAGFVLGSAVTNLVPTTGQVVTCLPNNSESIFLAPAAGLAALTWQLPSFANSIVGSVKMISSTFRVAALTVGNGGDATIIIEAAPPPAMEVNECYAYQCRLRSGSNVHWRRIA